MTRCAWEGRIESAAMSGPLRSEELAHVGTCADCLSVATTVGLLAQEGRAAEREAAGAGPPARAILASARLAKSQAALRRALGPIRWLERGAIAVGLLVLAGAIWWLSARASEWGDALRTPIDSLDGAPSAGMPSALVVWMAATVLVAVWYGLGVGGGRTRGR